MQKYPYLVAEKDGVIAGYAYAGAFVGRAAYDWSCETSIYLDKCPQVESEKRSMRRWKKSLRRWVFLICTPVSDIPIMRTNT
ncbi:MAG: N-acetyltransferase family protein [Oscillospiraceae bacterium]